MLGGGEGVAGMPSLRGPVCPFFRRSFSLLPVPPQRRPPSPRSKKRGGRGLEGCVSPMSP